MTLPVFLPSNDPGVRAAISAKLDDIAREGDGLVPQAGRRELT